MKKLLDFLKTTLLGGLLAVVPIAAVLVALGMVFKVAVDVITAMADVLPYSPLANTAIIFGLALVAVVAVCFGAGLLVRTAFGSAFVEGMHTVLSKHLPLYKMARNVAQNAAGMQGRDFDLALIDLHGSHARVLGAVMEELPGDRVAAFIPMSPTLAVGQVYLLPAKSVERMNVPIADFAGAISQWGVGAERLFRSGPSGNNDAS